MREYRRYINLYKYIRQRGVGWLIPWKPQTFRGFIRGWRQIIAFDIVCAVALVAYIIYKIL